MAFVYVACHARASFCATLRNALGDARRLLAPSPPAPRRTPLPQTLPADAPLRGVAPDVFKRGDVLAGGRFSLDEKLADGRFATIWLGSDAARGGRRVVLKVRGLTSSCHVHM